MPRTARELTALEVKRLRYSGSGRNELHFVGGVAGLALQLLPSGGRTWILRTTVGAKRRDIGLGGYPDVLLAAARERARETKELIRQGIDPVEHRKSIKSSLVAAQNRGLIFSKAVKKYLEIKSHELNNPKHRDQWASTLQTYAEPTLGSLLVEDITPQDILRALEPIWLTKTETASRLRGRIEAVLSWATVSGHRTGDNPARWTGNLKELLPAPNKVTRTGHWPAIALADAGSWFLELQTMEGTAARALEFLALCAARSGEVRNATWQEIDLTKGVWLISGDRMKTGREHRIPLSKCALDLLNGLDVLENNTLVFPAPRGGVLSDMAISAVMRRMHKLQLEAGKRGWVDERSGKPAVPHGLRSTFRDWAADSGYPRDLAEIALAHVVGSDAERAYRRTDMIERRRAMMEAWSNRLNNFAIENIIALEGKSVG